MGKGGKGSGAKTLKSAAKKTDDDDDALLDAAIAESNLLREKAATEAASTAAVASEMTAALDKLPVFTIANQQRQPLQFKVGKWQMVIFYADVAAAKKQLNDTKKQTPECDLIAVGLGSAYKLSQGGKAMIVPGLAELMGAGAPEGAQPMGQELPLFVCSKLGRYTAEGLVVPLYMGYEDCVKAVAERTMAENLDEADTQEDPALQISALTLQSVIEQLKDPASPAFTFVSPSASLKHVEHYVGEGVYMRRVNVAADANDEDAPPALT